jgi:hypothetical protein
VQQQRTDRTLLEFTTPLLLLLPPAAEADKASSATISTAIAVGVAIAAKEAQTHQRR